jgi:hypothetical protein
MEYVVLSYKWGQSKKYFTHTTNIEEHHRAIPSFLLPRTFHDAIHVAHQLGFKYLWIDALCIVQDSSADMTQEISRMGDIFRGSIVGIFAQAADHADAGLSVTRDSRHVKPCKINIKISVGQRCSQLCTFVPQPNFQDVELPLTKRGWVLQEEVLVPRALNFGRRQVEFKCNCGTFTEADPGQESDWIASNHRPSGAAQVPQASQLWRGGYLGSIRRSLSVHNDWACTPRVPRYTDSLSYSWYLLIQDYSQRALTYPMDVLPALAGIAKSIAQVQRIQYTNGLWENDLVYGLLWYAIKENPHGPGPSISVSEGSITVGSLHYPSWTWAALWGIQVKFWQGQLNYGNNHQYLTVDRMHGPERKICADPATCASEMPDEISVVINYQQVMTNALILTSYVSSAIVDYSRKVSADSLWSFSILDPETREWQGYVAFDFDPDLRRIDHITYILCAAVATHNRITAEHVSLAIVPTGQPEEFTRVGLVFQEYCDHDHVGDPDDENDILPHRWAAGMQRTTITLV